MKARLGYPFPAACALAALLVAAVAGAAGAGIFWLYVHGDDAWPGNADVVVATAAAALGAALSVLMPCAYLYGKSREASGEGGPTRGHVAGAVIASVLLRRWRCCTSGRSATSDSGARTRMARLDPAGGRPGVELVPASRGLLQRTGRSGPVAVGVRTPAGCRG